MLTSCRLNLERMSDKRVLSSLSSPIVPHWTPKAINVGHSRKVIPVSQIPKWSSLFVYFRSHLFWLWSFPEYGRIPVVLRRARARTWFLVTRITKRRLESHRSRSACPTVHTLLEKISKWTSPEQIRLKDLFCKLVELTVHSRRQ